MRTKSIWLQVGDENTKLFHHFANGRKLSNTIWSIDRLDGSKASSFEDIAKEGTTHFKSLLKVDPGANIDSIIRVLNLFPRFISPEENTRLVEEISMKELKKTLHKFQKDKIMGLDGFSIEFYTGCFEIIGEYLLNLVEYTKTTCKFMLPSMPLLLHSFQRWTIQLNLTDSYPSLYATSYTKLYQRSLLT
jgi:hypothetical protein